MRFSSTFFITILSLLFASQAGAATISRGQHFYDSIDSSSQPPLLLDIALDAKPVSELIELATWPTSKTISHSAQTVGHLTDNQLPSTNTGQRRCYQGNGDVVYFEMTLSEVM